MHPDGNLRLLFSVNINTDYMATPFTPQRNATNLQSSHAQSVLRLLKNSQDIGNIKNFKWKKIKKNSNIVTSNF